MWYRAWCLAAIFGFNSLNAQFQRVALALDFTWLLRTAGRDHSRQGVARSSIDFFAHRWISGVMSRQGLAYEPFEIRQISAPLEPQIAAWALRHDCTVSPAASKEKRIANHGNLTG